VVLPDRGIVLTDDGGLVMECLAAHIDALREPSILLALAEQGVVKKMELPQTLRFWGEQQWYKKKFIFKIAPSWLLGRRWWHPIRNLAKETL
jgi:hypothetical protein